MCCGSYSGAVSRNNKLFFEKKFVPRAYCTTMLSQVACNGNNQKGFHHPHLSFTA